ncbi:hypothetical protein E2C01_083706 [Portunus trituberculatus]|uniref:Uncharacterized protein n=1 Tax=Portunus trituberculatus TaxID=210409 RepID=A0A5B7J1Z8_PORTR|nr:hypothetical protein [Portunus trituberculatus]
MAAAAAVSVQHPLLRLPQQ